MIPYGIYKIAHIFGILLLFVALGGVSLHALTGGTREGNPARRLVAICHGTALVLVLVSGFGLLARIGMTGGVPGWAWAKIAIWAVLGGILVLPYRRPMLARPLLILLPALGALAAYLALYKPGF